MLLGKKGVPLPDHFVADDALGNLYPGIDPGDFTVRLWDPTNTEVSGSVAVTITEVGNGDYSAIFTPNAKGRWLIVITHPTLFPEGKRNSYDVYEQLFDDIEGESSGARIITFTVRETGAGPVIPDCTIQIFDPTLTTLYAFGQTDVSGQLIRRLDDGTYAVMLSKLASHTFDPLPKVLVVTANAGVIYEGSQFSPSSPVTPQTCIVYGFTHDVSDAAVAVEIEADLVEPKRFTTGGIQVVKSAKTVTSAALDGRWELVLTRSGEYTASDVKYSFKVGGVAMCEYVIPDVAQVNFADLSENQP